jgi:serine protease Do
MRSRLLLCATLLLAACGGHTPPVRIGAISMNGEVTGILTGRDPHLRNQGPYQRWRFYGTSGQTVTIDAMSDDFDAYAQLMDPALNIVARDDDTGEGLNARIIYTLQATGNYTIVVSAYRQNTAGSYRVRLTGGSTVAATPVYEGVVGAIARGNNVSGTIMLSDATLRDDTHYDAYTYVGGAGESITVLLESTQFDPYIIIQDITGNALQSNAGLVGSRAAQVTFTLPAAGTYRIVANTKNRTLTGAYRLIMLP